MAASRGVPGLRGGVTNSGAHGARKSAWDKTECLLAAAVAFQMGCATAEASAPFQLESKNVSKKEWRFGDWTHWKQSVTVTCVPMSTSPRALAMALLGGSTLEACGVVGFDVRRGLGDSLQKAVGRESGRRTHIFWFGHDQDVVENLARMRDTLAEAVASGSSIAGLRGVQLAKMRAFPRRDPALGAELKASVDAVTACQEKLDELVVNGPHVVDEVLATMGWQAAGRRSVQLAVVADVAVGIARLVRESCSSLLPAVQNGEDRPGSDNIAKEKPAGQAGDGGRKEAEGVTAARKVPGQTPASPRPKIPKKAPPRPRRAWLAEGVPSADVSIDTGVHAWCVDRKWLRRFDVDVVDVNGTQVKMSVDMPKFIFGLLSQRSSDDKSQVALTFARLAKLLLEGDDLVVVGNNGEGNGDCLFQSMETLLHVHGHERQDDTATCRQRCIDALVAEIQKRDKGVLAEWWRVTQESNNAGYRTVQQAVDKFNTARQPGVWDNGMDSLFVFGLELAYDCRIRVHTVEGDWEAVSPGALAVQCSHRSGESLGVRGYHMLNFPGMGHYEALADVRTVEPECWLSEVMRAARQRPSRSNVPSTSGGGTRPASVGAKGAEPGKVSGTATVAAAAGAPKPKLPGKVAGADADTERDSEEEGDDSDLEQQSVDMRKSPPLPVGNPSVQLPPGSFVARKGFVPPVGKPAAASPASVSTADTSQSSESAVDKRLKRLQHQLGSLGMLNPEVTTGAGYRGRGGGTTRSGGRGGRPGV